ncbi:MAG TPA: S8 family serine peptidase [Gemmatimonadales bacterium]|nr:S8 family serine peptidase [Gemmatimonadales bacterium]
MPKPILRLTLIVGAIVAAACVNDAPVTPTGSTITAAPSSNSPSLQVAAPAGSKSYLINFVGTQLPGDLARKIAAAGGTVTSRLDQIGVALASSADPAFASRAAAISGVASVDEDVPVQWVKPERVVDAGEVVDEGVVAPAATFGSQETFRREQWAPDAVHAPEAWDLGQRGAGARVAIVDGGIRSTHLDIAPNLDVAHSVSFVPGQPFNFDQARDTLGVCNQNDTFWHGTHVAGIVAAPGQNVGTVGISPNATIIGVKVLHCGSGSFGAVIAGIYYAATPIAEGGGGADIINMSLGAEFPRQGNFGTARLAVVIGKATTYAYQRGVTVFAALGNNATDLDHTANTIFVPAMSPHVIAVSATGPLGFAFGATNFDRPASYTNFGQSAVEFAGPGGDFALPGDALCALPRLPAGTVAAPCWVFDMVMAPCRGSGSSNAAFCWAAGTSMATPAASGVAALIIGRFGRVGPAEVERRLRQSADDLGKPGNDDFYGRGRINALRAIQ